MEQNQPTEEKKSGGFSIKVGAFITLALLTLGRNADTLLRGCARNADEVAAASRGLGDDAFRYSDEFVSSGSRFTQDAGGEMLELSAEYIFDGENEEVEEEGEGERPTDKMNGTNIMIYVTDRNQLNTHFGKDHPITKGYSRAASATGDALLARKALIPRDLRGFPSNSGIYELYGLFAGVKLNELQAGVLSSLTKKKIPATMDSYDNFIVLEFDAPNSFIRTTKGITKTTRADILSKVELTPDSHIIYLGAVDRELLKEMKRLQPQSILRFKEFAEAMIE
ncbi:MAG: hypothetical protein AAFY71_22045 [Bacteroidota bacterium]